MSTLRYEGTYKNKAKKSHIKPNKRRLEEEVENKGGEEEEEEEKKWIGNQDWRVMGVRGADAGVPPIFQTKPFLVLFFRFCVGFVIAVALRSVSPVGRQKEKMNWEEKRTHNQTTWLDSTLMGMKHKQSVLDWKKRLAHQPLNHNRSSACFSLLLFPYSVYTLLVAIIIFIWSLLHGRVCVCVAVLLHSLPFSILLFTLISIASFLLFLVYYHSFQVGDPEGKKHFQNSFLNDRSFKVSASSGHSDEWSPREVGALVYNNNVPTHTHTRTLICLCRQVVKEMRK